MRPVFDSRIGPKGTLFEVGVLHTTKSAQGVYHLRPLQGNWPPVIQVHCSSLHMMPENNVHPGSRKAAAEVSTI
jgi:hypothetical protein